MLPSLSWIFCRVCQDHMSYQIPQHHQSGLQRSTHKNKGLSKLYAKCIIASEGYTS